MSLTYIFLRGRSGDDVIAGQSTWLNATGTDWLTRWHIDQVGAQIPAIGLHRWLGRRDVEALHPGAGGRMGVSQST